jgi:hypothetical protein
VPIASASRRRVSQSARKLEPQSRACDGLLPYNGSLTSKVGSDFTSTC